MLPDQARQEMTKVGFRPPVAAEPTAEEALLAMLQQHEEELPQEIQKMIQARVSGPPPSATEVEIKATNDLKGASGRLRDLGHRKIRLQGRIDEVKAVLTGLYAEMKDLLQELQEAEAKMESLAQAFKTKVLQAPPSLEVEEFDCAKVLADLGVELDTTQGQKLHEAQEAHRQKHRQHMAEKALIQAGCPPGLGAPRVEPPGPDLCQHLIALGVSLTPEQQTAVAGTSWTPKDMTATLEALQAGAEDMDIDELEQGRKTIMEQLEIKRRRIQAGGQQARPNSGSSTDGGNKNPDNQDRSRSPKAKP